MSSTTPASVPDGATPASVPDGPRDTAAARPDAVRPLPAAREPVAAELARVASAGADRRLAAPAPVRLTDVVPAPADVEPDPDGDFVLTQDTAIRVTSHPAAVPVAGYLAGLLRPATGYPLPVTDATASQPADGLALVLASAQSGPASPDRPAGDDTSFRDGEAAALGLDRLGAEGYRLDVTESAVTIRAATSAGLFHGVQTLRQLLPPAIESPSPQPDQWTVPGGRITDTPRFGYRGAMLDVVRHFFPVTDVLRFIDHLARYKINHLHLHLTDDQGWRIAVDSWPRLGPVGGVTQVGAGPGGHYSRDDYRRIVTYAAERYITVVPEIDMPGHTHAALTSYGELAPDGTAPEPYTGRDVGFSTLNLTGERTWAFVSDVLSEIAELTPGPYLHIGGDEAFTVPADKYAAFVERAQRMVAGTGKTVVGWHQIATAGHERGRILQWWGTDPADEVVADAVRWGARLILSPGNHTYLDMKYTPQTPIGHDWAGLIDVRKAYDWDPGSHLVGVPAEAVLGVEAPLWTETVTSLAEIEYLTFPRLPAVAELGWSPAAAHDWAAFRHRLAGQAPRWTAAGIIFHRSAEVPWPPAGTPVPGQSGNMPTIARAV